VGAQAFFVDGDGDSGGYKGLEGTQLEAGGATLMRTRCLPLNERRPQGKKAPAAFEGVVRSPRQLPQFSAHSVFSHGRFWSAIKPNEIVLAKCFPQFPAIYSRLIAPLSDDSCPMAAKPSWIFDLEWDMGSIPRPYQTK